MKSSKNPGHAHSDQAGYRGNFHGALATTTNSILVGTFSLVTNHAAYSVTMIQKQLMCRYLHCDKHRIYIHANVVKNH